MLGLAKSSFYYCPKIPLILKEKRDNEIRDYIEIVHAEFPGYGYRRIREHLLREGIVINAKCIRRVMHKFKLFPVIWQKFRCITTDSNHAHRVYPNLVKDFRTTEVNQVWVADLTYIRIATCFVYLAVILDLFSRRVIGWALSKSLEAEVCLEALRMAVANRRPATGCIHHSDQGVQYACGDYIKMIEDNDIVPSMSRRGNCYDNAFAESFFKTLKYEEVHLNNYETFADVIERVPRFIEDVYNQRRLHSSLGYVPPAEFEAQASGASINNTDHPVH